MSIHHHNHIRQSNNYSCLACVAAMIVGNTTIEGFIKFVGHDGSEVDEESDHPDKRRGFQMYELADYLSKHSLHFGCHLTKDFGVSPDYSKNRLAVLTVVSKKLPPPNTHLVVWTGKVVFDSQEAKRTKLEDYEILEWWPITQWNPGRRRPHDSKAGRRL